MRKEYLKFTISFIIILFLIAPVGALTGSFFGNAREETGEIYNSKGEGEFISAIFDKSEGNKLGGLEIKADLENNSTALLVIESSADKFNSIAEKETHRIKRGKGKYYIQGELKGNYRRYIIKIRGKATLTTTPIESGI